MLRYLHIFIIISISLCAYPLHAQQTNSPTEPSPKKKSIQEQIRDYEELKKKAKSRIEAINAIIEPAKDKLASKLFEISPEEYAMLRLQAEATDSANKFFSARSTEVTSTLENIAIYFDEAYKAIKSGFLLYGQEQTLVKQDVDLYNKMQIALNQALLDTPKGAEYQALLDEKKSIQESLKNVDPVLLYHMERRNWFKTFPDLKPALEDAVSKKEISQ